MSSANLNSRVSWDRAINSAIDGQPDMAIKNFDLACNTAKQKTSVGNKLLFGDFSFLDESDQTKVENIYLQSSCAG